MGAQKKKEDTMAAKTNARCVQHISSDFSITAKLLGQNETLISKSMDTEQQNSIKQQNAERSTPMPDNDVKKGISNQDKITYLKRYKDLDRHINRLIEEKERWYTKATKVTPTISDMPHGSDGTDSRLEAIHKMMETEEEINIEIDKYVDMGREIKAVINSVEEENLRLLLLYRYIDGKTFEQITVDMSYSWKQVHRLHSKALNKIMS